MEEDKEEEEEEKEEEENAPGDTAALSTERDGEAMTFCISNSVIEGMMPMLLLLLVLTPPVVGAAAQALNKWSKSPSWKSACAALRSSSCVKTSSICADDVTSTPKCIASVCK